MRGWRIQQQSQAHVVAARDTNECIIHSDVCTRREDSALHWKIRGKTSRGVLTTSDNESDVLLIYNSRSFNRWGGSDAMETDLIVMEDSPHFFEEFGRKFRSHPASSYKTVTSPLEIYRLGVA